MGEDQERESGCGWKELVWKKEIEIKWKKGGSLLRRRGEKKPILINGLIIYYQTYIYNERQSVVPRSTSSVRIEVADTERSTRGERVADTVQAVARGC